VFRQVVERIHAEDTAKGGFAGLDAVEQSAPGLLRDAAEQERGGTHRTGHARAQAGADRRQRELPVLLLGEHARAGEESKDPTKRVRVR
jgi:hypothetical protein